MLKTNNEDSYYTLDALNQQELELSGFGTMDANSKIELNSDNWRCWYNMEATTDVTPIYGDINLSNFQTKNFFGGSDDNSGVGNGGEPGECSETDRFQAVEDAISNLEVALAACGDNNAKISIQVDFDNDGTNDVERTN